MNTHPAFAHRRFATLAVIVLAVTLFGLSAFFRYQHFEPPTLNLWGYGSDAAQYWDLSSNLMAHRGFVDSPGAGYQGLYIPNTTYTPDLIRLPGYPSVLALFRLAYNTVAVCYFLNGLFFLSLMISFRLILLEYFSLSNKSSCFCLLVFGLSPLFLVFNQGVQNDTFTCAVITALIYQVTRLLRASRVCHIWYHGAVVSVLGAIAALTKLNTVFFIYPLLFLIAVFSKAGRRRRWPLMAIGLFLMVSVLGWSARTYSITGAFRPAVYTGQNLFINFVYFEPDLPRAIAPWRGPARAEFSRSRLAKGVTPEKIAVELDQKLTAITLDYCRTVVWRCARTAVTRITGLVLTSYFEIADVIFSKIFDLPLIENHILERGALKKRSGGGYVIYRVINLGHQIFKWLLLICPVVVGFNGARKTRRTDGVRFEFFALAAIMFMMGTGLLTTVDRLVLPVYPVLFLCILSVFLKIIKIESETPLSPV